MSTFALLFALMISIITAMVGAMGIHQTTEHDYYTWRTRTWAFVFLGSLVVASSILAHFIHG